MITAHQTCMTIPIEDEYGTRNGKNALVFLDYITDVDKSYGEDADGHRGALLVEYEVLDAYIDAHDLKQLTEDEARYAIYCAQERFHNAKKHF